MFSWITLAAAYGFIAINLLIGYIRFIERIPKSRQLSFASGSSAVFISIYVLPNYSRYEQVFYHSYLGASAYFRVMIRLAAMIGLITFHGMERAARSSSKVRSRANPYQIASFSVLPVMSPESTRSQQ